jgi:hypothetical protein
MCPVQVKNKPDLNTLSGGGFVERRQPPRDLEVFDNFGKRQDQSLGIASGNMRIS